MPRECDGCGKTLGKKQFSKNQWRKQDGGRCIDCVGGNKPQKFVPLVNGKTKLGGNSIAPPKSTSKSTSNKPTPKLATGGMEGIRRLISKAQGTEISIQEAHQIMAYNINKVTEVLDAHLTPELCRKLVKTICPPAVVTSKKTGKGAKQQGPKKQEKNQGNNAEHQSRSVAWYPPGADKEQELRREKGDAVGNFENDFDENFYVPARIAKRNADLISAVNDFHFAMMNDTPRNQFYYEALKKVITPESVVIEIGTGSGLLSMMAAKLGAKHVTAIEANRSLARLAMNNMEQNNVASQITVLNKMSTDVTEKDLPYGRGDVLVSEILGTCLLSESALEFTEDARERLMKPKCHVIPLTGAQYVTLVHCEALDTITSVSSWKDIDFSGFNALKDTSTLIFTKTMGYRLSSMDYTAMTDPLAIFEVDFSKSLSSDHPHESRVRCQAKANGIIHAAVFSWEVHSDHDKTDSMTTHVEDTRDNFPRDMQWGQGIQILEDHVASEKQSQGRVSVPLEVKKGEWLEVVVLFSSDGILMQCLVERVEGNCKDGKAVGLDSLWDDAETV